jgi:nonsense-mediated mRNA decay protein 3
MWIWTEPHSMRLKLRLTIRADVGESPRCVPIQQRLPVEFVVRFKQCPDCKREYTNRTWQALVQVRQKRLDGPKKGLVILETALAKNSDVRKHVLNMQTMRNGFDFYFLQAMHAQQFASYISKVAPMKIKTTQKMVSEDVKNNTANIKHTTVCDLVPLCREDLVICDKRAGKDGCGAGKLTGRMCIVNKVSSAVHLVDAAPSRNSITDAFADLHPERYWKGEKHYRVIFSSERLIRFVVLDVELCEEDTHYGDLDEAERILYNGPQSGVSKYALADCTVARESDFGQTDETFLCTTHLGNLLSSGDVVLGYDLVASVIPGADEWSLKNSFNSSFVLPDVVLVKKVKNNDAEEAERKEAKAEKPKAGSSMSKRRERRKKKEEKKMRDLAAAASRMGFGEETETSEDPELEQS